MPTLRPSPGPRLLTVTLGLGQTVAFASSFYLMGVMGDAIAADLRLDGALVVALMSVALAVAAWVGPSAGRWIDARGGRPVLLASSLVFAAGLTLVGVAHGLAGLVLGMAVIGAGMAIGLYGTPFAILVEAFGDEARRPITGVALIGGLGSSIGWPVTLWLEQTLGWRGACLAWAGAHLLLVLPLTATIVPHAPRRAKAEGPPAPRVTWDPTMLRLAVLFSGAWFISTCMSAHLPRLLVAFGLTPVRAAGTAALVGVAAVGMRALEFTVLRRFAPLWATRAATLMHPLGAASLAAMGAAAAPLMALGQGAGNGMLTVAKGVLPLSLYGAEGYAYRSALLTRPAQIAQIGGPAIYGLALKASPQAALALGAAVCLVMFASTFGLHPHRQPVTTRATA